jgi:Fur family ferric uptake transcriptional regulator
VDAAGPASLSEGEVADRLRRAGFRITRPRLVLYRRLRDLGGHRSADDLTADLRRTGETVSRMSVYNVLATLQEAGLVMRADAGPGRALYEAGDAWHHHFVCRRCGRVFDVPCARGRKPCLRLPERLGRADEAQVVFRGVCRGCARRRAVPRVDTPRGVR